MRVGSLFRATVRGTTWFSTDGVRELLRKGKRWIFFVAGFGILVGLSGMMAFLVGTYKGLVALGQETGHPELVLFYAVLISWVFVFIESLPLALSALYYSKDTGMLLPLPLRPTTIVAAKFLLLYVYSLPVGLYLTVPAVILYGIHFGLSGGFVAWILLNLLVSPIVPLALATLLMVLLAKAVNISRHRVALEVVGLTLAIAFLLGIQVAISRTVGSTYFGDLSANVTRLPDAFGALERGLPPVAWFGGAFLTESGLVYAGLALLTAAVGTGAVFALAPTNFLRDTTERADAGHERRTVPAREVATAVRRRPVWQSLLRREWAILSSNSTFIFQAAGELPDPPSDPGHLRAHSAAQAARPGP